MGDESGAAYCFDRADYVLVLPLILDKYGMPTAESYKKRIKVPWT